MNLCPECGEPLDDFAPCACVLGVSRQRAEPAKAETYAGGMRRMVARKLARRAEQRAKADVASIVVRFKP